MDVSAGLWPFVSQYQPALLALAILSLIALVQSFLTAFAFTSGEQAPGMPLNGDHSMRSFRIIRIHANSVESLPALGFALVVAVLAGANASLVNWLALIHLGFRVAFWIVYFTGVGKIAGGPRTLCYVGGLLSNIALAVTAIFALIAG